MSAGADLTGALRQLADLAEIRGATSEAEDLRRAARAIAAQGPDGSARVARLARRNRLSDSPGLPSRLHWRIRELAETSPADVLAAASASLPDLIRKLLTRSIVDAPQACTIARQLGILTLADLELALDDGRVGRQLGAEMERTLTAAAAALYQERRAITLGRAWDLLESLLASMAEQAPQLRSIEPAGDVRRCEPAVSSVVLVGLAADPAGALDAICALPLLADVRHRGSRRAIVVYQGLEVDIRIAARDEHGTVLFNTTGSRAHVAAVLARRAPVVLCADEEQFYARSGLRYIPPELRQNQGEIEAAAADRLPSLVERPDIRGDLHMHTTYSDGRDTIADMVQACASLGYEYVAITDHSESAAASRTLAVDDIPRQRDQIERIRERFPGLAILHGVEVDILADGRLDFDDDVLERFEIVLASLHEQCGHDGRRLTERALAAIRHPLVTVLTHPQNRIPGRRDEYPLDFDALYAAAAETGTALEIDGAPGHLDLDGEHARAAAHAGAILVIDSDCHRARSLERHMRLGVGTARRGWVGPHQVLNTRPIADVRSFIGRKRGRAV